MTGLQSPFLNGTTLHIYQRKLIAPKTVKISVRSSMAAKEPIKDRALPKKHVIVCGAGVIGSCTAYYLSKMGARVTVVEAVEPACAASGKAGGFLALDWSSDETGKLANLSFALHEQLSEVLGVDYGFRKVDTLSLSVSEVPSSKSTGARKLPGWVDGPAKSVRAIGSQETTAQVHPKLFTKAILAAAVENYGATLRIGKVEGIETTEASSRKKISGVTVNGETLSADAVVVAMGPWSSQVKLVGSLTTISGLKANSIVLKPQKEASISAHMLFLHYISKQGKSSEPEIYPRPDGTVYVCGMSEEVDVPEDPSQIQISHGAAESLMQVAATVSSQLAAAECTTQQACFLPCSEDGTPVIGQIPGVDNAYVATGHSCWGILMAPATGLAMAELIVNGHCSSLDLSAFSPERFLAPSRMSLR